MEVWSVLYLLAVAIGVFSFLSIVSTLRHLHNARKMGCKTAPLYPSLDPFGIATLFETIHAARDKVLPELAEKRIDLLSRKHHRYVSTFRLRQAGRENLFTVDPQNIQAMLSSQFNEFGLGDMRRKAAKPLVGHGIFTSDGDEWAFSRSLLRPQFSRTQLNNLDMEERHVQNALQAIPILSDKWSPEVDIQTIFFRLTIDSATELLFGKSCDSQLAALNHDTGEHSDSFRSSFDRCLWYLSERLRFERLYWLINNREFRNSIQKINSFVDQYVHAALQMEEKKQSNTITPAADEKNTPLEPESQYIFLNALASTNQNPIKLRNESLSVLLAGRDTTASLLSWSILLLARHPDIFQKLRHTILTHFGPYRSNGDSNQPTNNITLTSLRSCHYLQHFLNETLRIYPVIPFNRRCANMDTTLPRGGGKDGTSPIYIRKGQPILFSTHVLHRRKDLWGDDADQFNPDRWESGRRVGWEYIPFHRGPRTCIGQQFALTKACYVLVRLLQRFDAIEDVNPDRRIRYGVTLTSCPAEPVTVRLHLAE